MAKNTFTRKFGGKVYRWYTAEKTRKDAEFIARGRRREGYLARVTLSKRVAKKVIGGTHLTPWQIWTRKK